MVLLDNQTIDARLADAHLKIITVKDDEKINRAMLTFGYDETRINEGLLLYNTAFDSQSIQKKEYGEQYAATEALQKALDELHILVMRHINVAHVAFKNHGYLLKEAELDESRKVTYTGWMAQTRQFYSVALDHPDAPALLNVFGLTPEILTAAQQKVEEVSALKIKQIHESGDAQDATKKRDNALEALEAWIADLVAISRVAFADTPQLLEKMGIKVAS
jgi:hypothetical protein